MAKTQQAPVLICCELARYGIGVMASTGPALLPVELPPDATPEQVADRLLAAIGRRRSVVVGLPSMACLVAAVETADLPRKNRRQAMHYRMEEHLPVAAEELAADVLDRGEWSLGIAVETGIWSPLVQAIEAAGISVAAVCPTALLALQVHQAHPSAASRERGEPCDALLWQDGEHLEVFFLSDGKLDMWYTLPAAFEDMALIIHSRAARSPGPFRMATRGVDQKLVGQIEALPGVYVQASDASAADAFQSVAHAATDAAMGIIHGRRRPLVDLGQHDALTGGRASSAMSKSVRGLVAAAVCCVCIAAAFLWRGTRYSAAADRFDLEKRSVFQQLFPGQDAPVGVASRLQSVEQALRGGVSADSSGIAGPPVLALLHDTLAHLPADVRCRWTEMRFERISLTLDGEVLRHADAGTIAASLRRARSLEPFTLDDPQTRQLDGGGVGFSISAALPPPAREEGGTP